MDWGHGVLLLFLFMAFAKVGSYHKMLMELKTAAEAVKKENTDKDKIIDRLQASVTKEAELVVKLQEDYSTIRGILTEMAQGRDISDSPLNLDITVARALTNLDLEEEEVLVLKEEIQAMEAVRPIRFRRPKDVEQ